jgi:hypothetical protein
VNQLTLPQKKKSCGGLSGVWLAGEDAAPPYRQRHPSGTHQARIATALPSASVFLRALVPTVVREQRTNNEVITLLTHYQVYMSGQRAGPEARQCEQQGY